MCNFEVFISIRRSHCVGFLLYLIYCLLEHIFSGWLVGVWWGGAEKVLG